MESDSKYLLKHSRNSNTSDYIIMITSDLSS